MSSFWSNWITVITLGNILACVWLIWWTMRKRDGESAEGDVTGHAWDGDLQEYNNPLPRWWLWMFYITIIFGFGYLYLYPGLGNYGGALGWTAQNQHEAEIAAADEKYGPIYAQYRDVSVEELAKNSDANAMGKRLYLTYCMQCHGSDARGSKGYPNLADNDWLWGGSPDMIEVSIAQGRRQKAPMPAAQAMPPWTPIIGEDGVAQVTEYVLELSGRKADAEMAAKGKDIYMTNCSACHMPDGAGFHALGAPRLNDNIWLFGKSKSQIKDVIANGRNQVMPAWKEMLGDDKVHVLTAYVYSLSNN